MKTVKLNYPLIVSHFLDKIYTNNIKFPQWHDSQSFQGELTMSKALDKL